MPRKDLVELMTIPELQEFNRSGAIPERLSAQVQGRMIEGIPAFGGDTYAARSYSSICRCNIRTS
jgi:hypothetical protein